MSVTLLGSERSPKKVSEPLPLGRVIPSSVLSRRGEASLNAETRQLMHSRAGNCFATWWSVAGDLLAAAQLLKEGRESLDLTTLSSEDAIPPEGRVGAVELMLRGMAVECLMKGLWVKNGNPIVKDGKYVKVTGTDNHDLVQLASAIRFELGSLEQDVLRRLSHFIQYGGRYPIPKRADELKLTKSPAGGFGPATT
jgi:hypothetical protein